MRLHTASEIISLARKLENESTEFYEELPRKYDRDEAVFLSFAKENKKNITQIEQTYYGVISDAIESGFAFDLEANNYTFEAGIAQNASYPDTLDKAITIEKHIAGFYSQAAEQSQSLMADVPRIFKLLAKKRNTRLAQLGALLKNT